LVGWLFGVVAGEQTVFVNSCWLLDTRHSTAQHSAA
jgi:hypothetical protein